MSTNYQNTIPLNFLYHLLELLEIDIRAFMKGIQENDPYTFEVHEWINKVYHYDAALHTTEKLNHLYWSN